MKKMYTILILACLLVGWPTKAQQINDSKEIVKYFNKIDLPFTTDNYYKYQDEALPYELTLKYFFRGDTSASAYYYEIYSDDENELTRSGRERYIILPLNYFYLKSILFTTYYRVGEEDDPEAYLSLWNESGFQNDSLVVFFKTTSDPELWKLIRSKIYEDKVVVFEYLLNQNKSSKENGEVTKISVCQYGIDLKQRKFILQNEETFNSKYYIFELYEGNKDEIKKEDPYYK
jgi:hypothetical protein